MWEKALDITNVREIRTRPTIYFGVGAIKEIDGILKKLKHQSIDNLLVITGANSYKVSGAWDFVEKALKENNIKYILSSNVEPNPTTTQADAAKDLGIKHGVKAVLAIGGGSVIDAAKSVAILLEYPEKTGRELFERVFIPEKAMPVITINLTHGTGSETDRFAVVTIPETQNKAAIGYECIYPLYSIDDPALMTKLSKEQTLYVTIDALNHVIESATTNNTNLFSLLLCKETVRLIKEYLPQVLENPEDLTARYYLTYAAMIAGIAFDSTGLHITHALAKFINALKPDFSHGLSLTMLLPAVLKQIYPQKAKIIADLLSPIIPNLTGNPNEAEKVAFEMEKWLFKLGLNKKLSDEGITEEDTDKLVGICMNFPGLKDLQSVTPMEISSKSISRIYRESL